MSNAIGEQKANRDPEDYFVVLSLAANGCCGQEKCSVEFLGSKWALYPIAANGELM
jgi:hypothetical protein